MWVAGFTLRPAGLTGGVWLKYADSWVDAGVNRGAARSWRWALGGPGVVVLASVWDDAPGGQQLISGFRGRSCLYSDKTECCTPCLLVRRDGGDICVLLCSIGQQNDCGTPGQTAGL